MKRRYLDNHGSMTAKFAREDYLEANPTSQVIIGYCRMKGYFLDIFEQTCKVVRMKPQLRIVK